MKPPCSDPAPDISVEIIACEAENAERFTEAEARAVASRIKEFQGGSCGDIALLFRGSSNLFLYENALTREGIRFQSLMGSNFYDLPEVRDVLSMLKYFLDPFDRIAEASVLRSPYFGASDDELFSHFQNNNQHKNSSRACEYLRFLDEKRKEYINGDTFRAVDFAVNGLGYSSAVLALPDAEVKCLNLKKFLLIVEDIVSRQGYGLYNIVEHFDSLRGSREEQAYEEVNDDRTVKLMTVHGAKGLEFDTVFLCQTNYKKPNKTKRVMADMKQGFIARYPAFSSDAWQHLKSRVEEKEAEEEKRVLYVAMTRARKRLFICLSGKSSESKSKKKRMLIQSDNTFAKFLDSNLSLSSRCLEIPQGFTDHTLGISFSGLCNGEVSKEPDSDSSISHVKREAPLDLKYIGPLYGEEDTSQRNDVSTLSDLFYFDRLKDSDRVGSIMHRFLETWDFREGTAEKEIEFVLGEFLVSNPEIEEKLRELYLNFLSSELFLFINTAQQIRRELKFVFDPGEGSPKRGRIDLLTKEDRGIRLFDYKYKYRNSINDDDKKNYEEQMDGYSEAISSRFKKPLLSRHIVVIPNVELFSI